MVIDADGKKLKKGDRIVSATLPDRRVYIVLEVGRKNSRNEGFIRTAVQHWERAFRWRLSPTQ